MPSVNCIGCGRAITVGDHLRGTRVMCPGCYASVEVLGDPTPLAAHPEAAGEGPDALAFTDTPASRRAALAPVKSLESAAYWLCLAFAFDALGTAASCLVDAARGPSLTAFLVGVAGVAALELLALAVIGLGILQMMTRGRRGLAVLAAAVILPASLWFLYRAARVAQLASEAMAGSGIIAGLLFGLSLLAAAGGVVGLAAGVRALLVLNNPAVRKLFEKGRRGEEAVGQ